MEHRSALIVDMELTQADGRAEREAALAMLGRLPRRKRRRTVAADKAYDTRDFVASCRTLGITAHVAQNTTNRRSAIDRRTTRHPGHRISQRIRKRIGRTLRLGQDHRQRRQAPVQGPTTQPGVVPDSRSGLQVDVQISVEETGCAKASPTEPIRNGVWTPPVTRPWCRSAAGIGGVPRVRQGLLPPAQVASTRCKVVTCGPFTSFPSRPRSPADAPNAWDPH